MATFEIDCAGCNRRFTSSRTNARWCSAACKTRAQRVAKAEAKRAAAPSPLVERLRADLVAGDVADSFDGLLALELAERIAKSGATSALVRELRSLKAAALGEEPPMSGDGGDDGEVEPAVVDPGLALVLQIEERSAAKRADSAAAG